MSLFIELKRRHVIRVGAAYLVVSWLLLQIAETLGDLLSLPEVVGRTVVLLLVVGFPLVLIAAWIFELTPEGIQTQEKADQSGYRASAGKLNVVVIGGLVIALVLVVLDRPDETVELAEEQQTELFAPPGEPEKSIAVLPFADLSEAGDQEYFTDGLSDELLNKLAQVEDLSVVARTSSFSFRGRNEDVRVIGETLGVVHVLEGSVRKAEDDLLITAQLINAETGFQLWSETYESTLSDIFSIQEEIATQVATALSVSIGAGIFNTPGMTRNAEAYDLALQANLLLRSTTPDEKREAISYAEQAVVLDPGSGVLRWVLARSYEEAIGPLFPQESTGFRSRQQEELAIARELAPEHPIWLISDAMEANQSGNWLEAEQILQEFFNENNFNQMDAFTNWITPVNQYAGFLQRVGRVQEALVYYQRAKRQDPLSWEVAGRLAESYAINGRFEEGLAEAERAVSLGLPFSRYEQELRNFAIETGNAEEIANATFVQLDDPDSQLSQQPQPVIDTFRFLAELLIAEDRVQALVDLNNFVDSVAGQLPPFFLDLFIAEAVALNDPGLALELIQSFPDGGINYYSRWRTFFSDMRQSPEFKSYVEEIGLVDYWRSTGEWGDFCQPLEGGDDFECF